jgi:UDPglucose 6-dehydrogenase
MKKIAIIGYGFVGKAMSKLFPDALVYDPFFDKKIEFPQINFCEDKSEINKCDVAFVCLPTAMLPNGECDTSIVEETICWLNTPLIIIRSTVKPGTTNNLIELFAKDIIFIPEYVGETVAHPLLDEKYRDFLIIGCRDSFIGNLALEVYQEVYNSSLKVLFLTPTEAEIVKYMENTAIGSMVTLCNEFYNICETFGVNYNRVREGFLLDPRMSRYFTFVYPRARGFGGKCLPKDLNAIAAASKQAGYQAEFIEDILKNNTKFNNQTICQKNL